LDYAVRAATLWSATLGGTYAHDAVQTCPLCWVPLP
jgi:hypothetical protein